MIRVKLSKKLGEERMTQATLARMTGIRPTTISDLYNEMAARVGLEQLDKICEALNCPLSDILEYVPNKKI
jgi:putative transcriptional regulator